MTKTRWVTVTKRRAAPGKGRRDEIPRVQEPAEGQQVSKVGRKLEKRNLCPVCPSNFNSAKASLLRRTYDSSSPVEYCCPAYVKPSGNTIYITKTRTRTINQPGNVKGSETTSAMKQRPTKAPVDKTVINVARTTKSVKKTFAGGSRPVYTKKGNLQSSSLHIGLIYNDYDNDGKYDPGVDTALAKQWVALSIVLDEKNNTFLGRAQTDNEGRFYYMATSAYSRANLSALVVLPGGNVFSFNSITDTMGNSKTMLAVPPPALNIVLFYDRDGNGVQAATETGAANQKVNIRYSDGTLWQTGISSTNGTIKIMYKPRLAYLPIVVETADGKIKKEVALDGDGELFATLALPPDPNAPPETPSVQSKVSFPVHEQRMHVY